MDAQTAESLLAFAERSAADVRGADAEAALAQIERRLGDLSSASQWFVDNNRIDDALRLASALYIYWIEKQRFDDGAAWFDQVLESPGGDDRVRGTALVDAGFMPFWKGDVGRASELFGQGLEIGRRLGDPRITSRALGGLVRVELGSDVSEGRRLAREALAVSDAADDRAGRSNAMHLLGVGAQIAGDLQEARTWMTQRLALVREDRNESLIASEAANLSMVERQLGDLDRADVLVREALEIAERRGDEFMKPFALSGLAAIATDRGAFERAATLVGAAEAMMEAQGAAWPPDERPHYERMLAVLPESMGTTAFAHARAAGQSMSRPEAVAYALGTKSAAEPAPI